MTPKLKKNMLYIPEGFAHGFLVLSDIAEFVYNKVATSEGVLSTATHFILKKYKSNGIFFEDETTDDRQAIVL